MYGRQSYLPPMTPVVKNLIIINALIWAAMMFFPDRIGLRIDQYGALYYWESANFNPAQVFTYMFIHSQYDISHLVFNMFTLWMFGGMIEIMVGSKRFIFYYLACGVGAALIQEGVYTYMVYQSMPYIPEGAMEQIRLYGYEVLKNGMNYSDAYMRQINLLYNIPTVGASGAIYGILLAFGYIFPNRHIYLYFMIPVKAKYLVILWGVGELMMGVAGTDSVAHFCHLGGMIAGLIILLYWRRKGLYHTNRWN